MAFLEIFAIFFSLPILGIVLFFSLNKDYSVDVLITWSLFGATCVGMIIAAIVNSVIQASVPIIALPLCALNEEFYKFLLIGIFLYRYKDIHDFKKSFFLGATASLGFAFIENIQYLISEGENVGYVTLGIVRLVLPTPMHFITGGITAMFFYRLYKRNLGIDQIFYGLSITTVIHSFYNLLVPTLIGGVIVVAIGFFIAYKLYSFFINEHELSTINNQNINIYAKGKSQSNKKVLRKKRINIITKNKS